MPSYMKVIFSTSNKFWTCPDEQKSCKSLALFSNLLDGVEHGQKCVGSKNGQHFNFTNFSKLETFMLGEKIFFSQKNS